MDKAARPRTPIGCMRKRGFLARNAKAPFATKSSAAATVFFASFAKNEGPPAKQARKCSRRGLCAVLRACRSERFGPARECFLGARGQRLSVRGHAPRSVNGGFRGSIGQGLPGAKNRRRFLAVHGMKGDKIAL